MLDGYRHATSEQIEWLDAQFRCLTTAMEVLSPSQWAEKKRYLPPSVTAMPGYYSFDVAPFMREPLDCLGVESPVRMLTMMKGAQVCATTSLIENAIGYYIEHVKTAPMMLLTADAEMAKRRIDMNITPMLEHSGLYDLITSTDSRSSRKTGKTDSKTEWEGGGSLTPYGAQNANKLRSDSIQVMMRDEIDAYPMVVGKDGDPLKLSFARTKGYELTRKVVNLSTPLIKGQSAIHDLFKQGDQRYYFVCCVKCGHPQVLRWRHVDPDTGEVSGIAWDTAEGRLVPGSVRYLCQKCAHPHINDDKTRMLAPEHGAEWRPTAHPDTPEHRSYHLSALYSPVGLQSWEAQVLEWLEAWDPEKNAPRDLSKLQVVYNNIFGDPFELRGERILFSAVSPHRRHAYKFGDVPNDGFCVEHCGGPVLALTCAVDVHGDNLAVSVFGWCRDSRAVLVNYWRFEGDTEDLDCPETWGRLEDLIDNKIYEADDGKRYKLALTLIDSGYRADVVYRFCAKYGSGVYPIKGRDLPTEKSRFNEFSRMKTDLGTPGFLITVDVYKERWAIALRRGWDGQGAQPTGHFNAPLDVTDKQLRELTKEVKQERIEKSTGKRVGWKWVRASGARNELWDLLVYSNAALELLAYILHIEEEEREQVVWPDFWDELSSGLFFSH